MIAELVGQELVSEWREIDQARVDLFADATDDPQWIHVDPERAAQGPFGSTIAHGFLTLSLVVPLFEEALPRLEGYALTVNYGLNRVRFTAPVRVGSRLRGRFKLLAYEPIEGGAQLTMEVQVEVEGGAKPACVAESLSRRFT